MTNEDDEAPALDSYPCVHQTCQSSANMLNMRPETYRMEMYDNIIYVFIIFIQNIAKDPYQSTSPVKSQQQVYEGSTTFLIV
jgi:hypothetical protein